MWANNRWPTQLNWWNIFIFVCNISVVHPNYILVSLLSYWLLSAQKHRKSTIRHHLSLPNLNRFLQPGVCFGSTVDARHKGHIVIVADIILLLSSMEIVHTQMSQRTEAKKGLRESSTHMRVCTQLAPIWLLSCDTVGASGGEMVPKRM